MSKRNGWLMARLARLELSIALGLALLIGLLLMLNDASPASQAHAADFTAQITQGERVADSNVEAVTIQTSTTTTLPIPSEGAYLGAYIGDLADSYEKSLAEIQEFERMTDRRLAIINRYWGMTIFTDSQYAKFEWLHLDQHFDAGRITMISWNPVNSTTGLTITYQAIINGKYDYVIRDAARNAATFGKPLFLRWAWEMDGDWYAHSGPNAFGPDGTQSWRAVQDLYGSFGDPTRADGPERFVAAWRHIRAIFVEERATNVIWVWSPNWLSSPIPTPGLITTTWNTLAAYYPGDDQVDWIGTSIYYRGDNIDNQWLAFPDMFAHERGTGDSIAKFAEQHNKPVMIAEMGAAEKIEDPQAKARWITTTYGTDMKSFPRIKALLWFSVIKEEKSGAVVDWRVCSSKASLQAFRDSLVNPYYLDQVFITYTCPTKVFLPVTRRS